MLGHQPVEERAVETLGVEVSQALGAALGVVLHQAHQHLHPPGDAPLQVGGAQGGEAVEHAAEEHALGRCLVGAREVPHVVVGEVGGGAPSAPSHGARVEGGHETLLHERAPERVVVVGAVEAQGVDPEGLLRAVVEATPGEAAEHHGAQPELAGGEVELLEGLFRRDGGDDRHRREAIFQAAEGVRGVAVVGPGAQAPGALVALGRQLEPDARVADGEVDAELGQPLMQEPGRAGSGEVPGVVGEAPPGRPEGAARRAFLGAQGGPVWRAVEARRGHEGRHAALDALLLEIAIQLGPVLHEVAVGIDDGVVEGGADLGGRRVGVAHGGIVHRAEAR